MKKSFQTTLVLFLSICFAQACLWDRDTLKDETSKRPKMAEVILGKSSAPKSTAPFAARIEELRRAPSTNDVEWYNDLAGAYIRAGKPDEAVKLLEPVLAKFDSNYGVHANLGTAYHLLGRYQDAEREIARDLEINPNAHFGLEKYHLALLQYLCRDEKYRARHVYVDEFSLGLFDEGPGEKRELEIARKEFPGGLAEAEKAYEAAGGDPTIDKSRFILPSVIVLDPKPAYRAKWNLKGDPKFEEGILYMASLNGNEPACFVMLGLVCSQRGDLNLAIAAYEKAIRLGSVQENILKQRITEMRAQQPNGKTEHKVEAPPKPDKPRKVEEDPSIRDI